MQANDARVRPRRQGRMAGRIGALDGGRWARPAAPGFAAWTGSIRQALAAWIAEEADRRSAFLWSPVAFGGGILLYFAAEREPSLWAGPVLTGFAALAAGRAAGAFRPILVALALLAAGFTAGTVRTWTIGSPMLDREIIGEIRGLVENVDDMRTRQRLLIRPLAIEGVAEDALPFRVRVGAPGRNAATPGDFVVIKARLAPPSEAAMPGGYDFRRDAFFRATGGVGYAIGPIMAAAGPDDRPLLFSINAAIDRWRNALTARIAGAIGGEAGALSAALVTGKRGLISEATNDDLRLAGLYHVVSISGLHMVLAAGVLFWSIRAMLAALPSIALRYPIKKIAAGFAMGGAVFYCLFSGSEVATERSLIMTLVMLGAILVDRPALAMRNLAISALLVLAREPESLLGPSFQMSFAAVACLIAANQVWNGRPRRRAGGEPGWLVRRINGLALGFAGIAATTVVATLATAPFSAFHFHRLNPYGLIGNSLGIPLVSLVVMPAAVAGTLLTPFGLDGFIWRIMGEGVAGMLAVAQWVARFDQASVTTPGMQGGAFALLVGALLVFTGLRTALRWSAALPLAAGLALLGAPSLPDLVIDPSGRMLLLRGEHGSYRVLAAGSPSKFTLAQWLPALGDDRRASDATLRHGTRCDKSGCIGRLHDGRPVALTFRLDALRDDCRRAAIIVTPLTAPMPCAAKLLDRTHFDRYGATILTATGPDAALTLRTTLDPAVDRPWRRQPHHPLAPRPPVSPYPSRSPAYPESGRPPRPPAILNIADNPDDDPALAPPEPGRSRQ